MRSANVWSLCRGRPNSIQEYECHTGTPTLCFPRGNWAREEEKTNLIFFWARYFSFPSVLFPSIRTRQRECLERDNNRGGKGKTRRIKTLFRGFPSSHDQRRSLMEKMVFACSEPSIAAGHSLTVYFATSTKICWIGKKFRMLCFRLHIVRMKPPQWAPSLFIDSSYFF